MKVKLRLDARTHDGGHASASYELEADEKHLLYVKMAAVVQKFARDHGVNPAAVEQSSTWYGDSNGEGRHTTAPQTRT